MISQEELEGSLFYFSPDIRDGLQELLLFVKDKLQRKAYAPRSDLLNFIHQVEKNIYPLVQFEVGSLKKKGTPIYEELFWVAKR